MRKTEASGWIVRSSSRARLHAIRLGAVTLGLAFGVGLVMTAGPARAGDDDDSQKSFSEIFMDGFHSTIRGTTMDNRGIDYRERSPLVVPPSIDLPPPAAAASAAPQVANWPKDPDERQRKAIIAAKKKNAPPPVAVAAAPGALPPVVVTAAGPARPVNIAPPVVEAPPPAPGTVRPASGNDANGTARIDPVYDQPGDLFRGGAAELVPSSVSDTLNLDKLGLGNLFGGKKADPNAPPPSTEPTREALTQPPSGYQMPSPNYPYSVPEKGLFGGQANPENNPRAAASSASSVVH